MKKYDAFISYRHADRDSWVAETIHKRLEHFHVPKEIRLISGKKKINRVFRDKEELSLTDDLTQEIYEALDASEFLIVICSPSSRESVWVDREVQYFLQHHDRKKLMIVHAGGELGEVLPQCISGKNAGEKEYLAANFCGDNREKLTADQKDELLKMIAAMFGVKYDLLKKRHQVDRRRQIARIASIVMVVEVIFGGYSAFQKHQLALVKKERLEQRAEMTADTALDLLRSGDRDGALEMALSVREENQERSLVSPKQTYVLNEALRSYTTGEWLEYSPAGVVGCNLEESYYSNDGQYLFALDEDKNIFCYSTDSETELWKLDNKKLAEAIEAEKYRFSDIASADYEMILPYDENKLVVVQAYVVSIVSGETGRVEMIFPVDKDFSHSDRKRLKIRGDLLVGGYLNEIYSYDLCTGRRIAHFNYGELLEKQYFGEGIELDAYSVSADIIDSNDSGTRYVFSLYDSWGTTKEEGVFLYNLTEDSLRCLTHERTSLVEFIDETHIAAIHVKNNSEGISSYRIAVYDAESGEEMISSDPIISDDAFYSRGILLKEFQGSDKSMKGLVFYLYDRLFILDLERGVIAGKYSCSSKVIQLIDWGQNSFLVGTESEGVWRIRFSDDFDEFSAMAFVPLSQVNCSYVNASDRSASIAVQVNGQDIFYRINSDSKMECLELKDWEEAVFRNIDCYYLDTGSFWVVQGQDQQGGNDCLVLLDVEIMTERYRVVLGEGCSVSCTKLYEERGNTWLSFIEYGNSEDSDRNRYTYHQISVDTGEEYSTMLSDELRHETPIVNSKYRQLICEKDYGILVMISFEGGTIVEEKTLNLDSYRYECFLSGDERYLFLIYSNDDAFVAKIYDFEENEFFDVEGISTVSDYGSTIEAVSVEQSSKICVYLDKSLFVVDCSAHKVLSEISLGRKMSSSELSFSFFDHDKNLLVLESGKVKLYDADSGEYRSSVSFDPRPTSKLIYGGSIQTQQNNRWFSIWNNELYLNSISNAKIGERLIFTVDKDLNMYPYAEVARGFADFETETMMIPFGNKIYSTRFYDDETLIREAEEVLNIEQDSADEEGSAYDGGQNAGSNQMGDDSQSMNAGADTGHTVDKGQEINKDADGSQDPIGANSTETDEKKIFTDASERNVWEINENITSVEAEDHGDSYILSIPNEQLKKIENISAHIFIEAKESEDTVYYKVLTGRNLEVNAQNQIVFPKNQEILGIWNDDHSRLIPVLRLEEETEKGVRSWRTKSFYVNDDYSLSDVLNLPRYLYVKEGIGGKLEYIHNSDQNKTFVREEDKAFIRNAHFVLSNTVGGSENMIRSETGAVLPSEKWNVDYIKAVGDSIDFSAQPQILLEELDAFDDAYYGQICIYYTDGTIQTTDILPLKARTHQYSERYVLKDGRHEWTFDLYPEYAVLIKCNIESGIAVIPSEVKGIPVTTIETGAFQRMISSGEEEQTLTVVIPASVHNIKRKGLQIDRKMNIELTSEENFVIRDGLLMTSDGKRVICGLDCNESELVIPDGVETIDPFAFCYYSDLEKVHFPEGLKVIESYAFSDISLREILLPDSLEFIGAYAFGVYLDNWDLEIKKNQECKSVWIGKNVQFIGENAFSRSCIREFSVDPENSVYCSENGVIYTKDKKVLAQYPTGKNDEYMVPDGVEIIPVNALKFSGFYRDVVEESWGVTELRLSDSVKTLEYGNVPIKHNFSKVVLGKGLEIMDDFLKDDVLSIVELSEDSPIIQDLDGSYYSKDRSKLLRCSKQAEEYIFPETVTSITSSAFSGCKALRKITIPAGVDLDAESAEILVWYLNDPYSHAIEVEEMEVGEGNPDFSMVDGKLMSASGKTVLCDQFKKNTSSGELKWEVMS